MYYQQKANIGEAQALHTSLRFPAPFSVTHFPPLQIFPSSPLWSFCIHYRSFANLIFKCSLKSTVSTASLLMPTLRIRIKLLEDDSTYFGLSACLPSYFIIHVVFIPVVSLTSIFVEPPTSRSFIPVYCLTLFIPSAICVTALSSVVI